MCVSCVCGIVIILSRHTEAVFFVLTGLEGAIKDTEEDMKKKKERVCSVLMKVGRWLVMKRKVRLDLKEEGGGKEELKGMEDKKKKKEAAVC